MFTKSEWLCGEAGNDLTNKASYCEVNYINEKKNEINVGKHLSKDIESSYLEELQVILNDMFLENRLKNRSNRFTIAELQQIERIKNLICKFTTKYQRIVGTEKDNQIRYLFVKYVSSFLKTANTNLYSKLVSQSNSEFGTVYIIDKVFETNWPAKHKTFQTEIFDADDFVERGSTSPSKMETLEVHTYESVNEKIVKKVHSTTRDASMEYVGDYPQDSFFIPKEIF